VVGKWDRIVFASDMSLGLPSSRRTTATIAAPASRVHRPLAAVSLPMQSDYELPAIRTKGIQSKRLAGQVITSPTAASYPICWP